MPLDLITDMEVLHGEELEPLRADLFRGEHARQALAMLDQERIAKANDRIERAHVDGLGELEMVVSREIYFRMMLLFGPDCWQDEEFRRHCRKLNPSMRVKTRARNTTVRMATHYKSADACTVQPRRPHHNQAAR